MPSVHAMPSGNHSDRIFNPGDRDTIVHSTPSRFDVMTQLLWAVEDNPLCNDHCQSQLLKIVSCHVKSRGLSRLRAAAGAIRALSELYDAFLMIKEDKVHHIDTAGLEWSPETPLLVRCNLTHAFASIDPADRPVHHVRSHHRLSHLGSWLWPRLTGNRAV